MAARLQPSREGGRMRATIAPVPRPISCQSNPADARAPRPAPPLSEVNTGSLLPSSTLMTESMADTTVLSVGT